MAGVKPESVNFQEERDKNSMIMCYSKKAIEAVVSEVSSCMEANIEGTVFAGDDVTNALRTRFVEIYRTVLNANIQISDEVHEFSSESSTQSGGSVVTEKKQKYLNEELMPELDGLILATADCRKKMPAKCVKQYATQCSHECKAEAERVVQLEIKSPLNVHKDGSQSPTMVIDSLQESYEAVSGLSMAFPKVIQEMDNLEKVRDMQSAIGKSKVDRIVFNSQEDEVQTGQVVSENKTESIEEGFHEKEQILLRKLRKGVVTTP